MRANLSWNTWDVAHVNGVVHLETGIRLRWVLVDLVTGERKEQFDWQHDLVRLGPHSGETLGIAEIVVRWQETSATFTFSAQADCLVTRVCLEGSERVRAALVVDGKWETRVRWEPIPDGLRIYTADMGVWHVRVRSADAPLISETEALIFVDHVTLAECSPESAAGVSPAAAFIEEQAFDYDVQRLKTGGWLGASADGLTRSIHWNTIWEPIKGRICSPVSREWCNGGFWGSYVLFDWDTFFCGLMASMESPEIGIANFRAILQEITPAGFVPNFGSARWISFDRSQPPVGAYCVLKSWRAARLAESSARIAFLRETFDLLNGWHQWWRPHRDGNGDGLLEWGSDPLEDPNTMENYTLRAAMYESGLDNSPMYDEAVFNPSTHTMELVDVGLNALYALDAWALSEIAAEIGRNREARALHEEYVEMAEAINRHLWNDAAGIYQNRHWDGRFSPHLSPTNFYPLIAGIVPPERALRMVQEHLLNPKEFWGEFVLPSISRSDPGYRRVEILRDGISEAMSDYWRGRVWGPMNFLVCEGLRRYGFDREAHEFSLKSVRLFLQEWDQENHVHENYNDQTGEGDDVPSANALYHWGALLGYLGIQELADCEAWEGWRFGCLDGNPAWVEGIQTEEGRLGVSCSSEGLEVSLDGSPILKSSSPVIVRGYRIEPGRLQFRLNGEVDQVQLRIYIPGVDSGAQVKTRVGQIFEMGRVQTVIVNPDGGLDLNLPVPCEVEITA